MIVVGIFILTSDLFNCLSAFSYTKNKPESCSLTVALQVCSLFVSWLLTDNQHLFALVSVLSQSFFTLVRSHLVSFFLLTAWHSFKILWVNTLFNSLLLKC